MSFLVAFIHIVVQYLVVWNFALNYQNDIRSFRAIDDAFRCFFYYKNKYLDVKLFLISFFLHCLRCSLVDEILRSRDYVTLLAPSEHVYLKYFVSSSFIHTLEFA